MFFSIVMPLYDKAPYVAKAIRSVLLQTFSDYELIVVDDGSRDDSAEIARQAMEGYENCRLLKQDNQGVSMARNNGVAVSSGDYLCFLDADDWWNPRFLEEMSGLISDFHDAGIYGAGYTIVNETKHKTRVAPVGVEAGFESGYINYCQVYAKTLTMPLTSSSVAIPRAIFAEMGGFPVGVKMGEDFLLWVRIALKHQVAFLNKPLAFYNQDVDVANRGVKKTGYEPDSFMTFYFDQFAEEESKNKELKVLLDKIRVYSLLRFRVRNEYVDAVASEIEKVDFENVKKKYRFYYKAPYFLVWLFAKTTELGSSIRRILI